MGIAATAVARGAGLDQLDRAGRDLVATSWGQVLSGLVRQVIIFGRVITLVFVVRPVLTPPRLRFVLLSPFPAYHALLGWVKKPVGYQINSTRTSGNLGTLRHVKIVKVVKLAT